MSTNAPQTAGRPAPTVSKAAEAATEQEAQDKAHAATATIPLVSPFKVGGIEKTQLVMRRPKVADRLNTASSGKPNDVEAEAYLLANLVGLAPEEIRDMDLADYEALQEQFKLFTGARRKS